MESHNVHCIHKDTFDYCQKPLGFDHVTQIRPADWFTRRRGQDDGNKVLV